jgi:predicted ATPase
MAVQYCEGHCFPYTIATPYLPVLDLLRQLCGITAADNPEVMTAKVVQQLQAMRLDPEAEAPVLLTILDVPVAMERLAMLSPQARKARIFALLLQMSLYRSQQQPLILAVENVHWIDATSEEWLTTLVERLTGAAILLLVTSRPGYHASWLEQAVVTRLALPPLLPDESLAVVQSVLHTEHLPEPLVPEILTKAAGNPFFLEELAWSIVEHGPQQGPLTVPDTIQSVLAARIDRLPPAEKQLLQVAAVIGKELTFALLQAVTTRPEAALHTSLRHLQNAEFLYETRTVPVLAYTFKHALTQEVAYQSLLKSTRQQQHQTIAAVLETQFPDTIEIHPELLAHHYTEAGVAVAAVTYWQRAGRRAYERSANREAISYLTNGLEILQTLPDTSARLQQEILLQSTLGAAYTAARGYAAPEVEQAYNRARELCQQAGNTRQLFPILVGLWNFYFVRGASQTACELGEQLCAMAQEAQDSSRLLRAHAALGEILFHTGNLVQARHHLEQGMALYNPHQHRSHAVQTPTVACLAYMAWT